MFPALFKTYLHNTIMLVTLLLLILLFLLLLRTLSLIIPQLLCYLLILKFISLQAQLPTSVIVPQQSYLSLIQRIIGPQALLLTSKILVGLAIALQDISVVVLGLLLSLILNGAKLLTGNAAPQGCAKSLKEREEQFKKKVKSYIQLYQCKGQSSKVKSRK